MASIFGEGKLFWKLQRLHSLDILWVENFDEIALSRTVKEIEANLCFAIFGKNSKIQNGRHFWGGENFLKIAKSTLLRYPVTQKFCPNRSISYGFWDIKIFSFFAKIQDGRQKWRKLKIENFVQNTLLLPCESKILSKSLYLLRFLRY